MSAEDPVRLPARAGGWTSARHRSVAGTDHEVSDDALAGFALDAREREKERRQAEMTPVAAAISAVAIAQADLQAVLAATRKPFITPGMRRRARRVTHELQHLRRELRTPTT